MCVCVCVCMVSNGPELTWRMRVLAWTTVKQGVKAFAASPALRYSIFSLSLQLPLSLVHAHTRARAHTHTHTPGHSLSQLSRSLKMLRELITAGVCVCVCVCVAVKPLTYSRQKRE